MEQDELFVKRLSFIKYLFDRACETSGLDQPLCNATILGLQDGVELFLDLALEYKDINRDEYLQEVAKKNNHKKRNDINFMEYWDVFENKGIQLSGKDTMRKVNEARVELKHRGTFIEKTSIDCFIKSTATFFKDNCKTLFDIDFDSFSMLYLVKESEWKDLLKEAEMLISEEKWVEANQKNALAFYRLRKNYEGYCKRDIAKNPEYFAQFLGLNSSKYNLFLKLSPEVKIYYGAGVEIPDYHYNQPGATFASGKSDEELATPERVKFCFDYVIETAIALQNKYDRIL